MGGSQALYIEEVRDVADKPWKRHERQTAKKLGGKRIPASGAAQFPGETGDVLHSVYEIECKYRKKLPVADWFEETRARSSKTPLLVLKKKGMKGELVVISMDHFIDLTERPRVGKIIGGMEGWCHICGEPFEEGRPTTGGMSYHTDCYLKKWPPKKREVI